jgi:hypoxanthine phosphoribosyltransferase
MNKYEKVNFSLNEVIDEIKEEFKKNNHDILIVLPIMTGAMQFTVELLKNINGIEDNINHIIHPVIIKSYYVNEQKTSPTIKYFQDIEFVKDVRKYKNPMIMIIDDIIDTGETVEFLIKYINKLIDNKIYICSLVWKSNKSKINPDFYCIEDRYDRWWVGFGMDDNDMNRFTKSLYYLIKT